MHINIVKEIKQSGTGRAGFIILAAVIIAALLAPVLSAYDPNLQSAAALLPPSPQHPLGTNHLGQDIWSQLLHGARSSLLVGFGAGGLSLFFSMLFGLSAALTGGLYDRIVMRAADALLLIPPLIVVVLATAYIKPALPVLIIILSVMGWPGGARIIRAQTLFLKEKAHIHAAGTFGAGRFYLTRRHILPDLAPVLLVELIHGVRRAVFMEAGLAFLGVGDPALVSWGTMMREAMGFSYLNVWAWWLVPPGVALSLTITSLTFAGQALEPAVDPRLRGENYVA